MGLPAAYQLSMRVGCVLGVLIVMLAACGRHDVDIAAAIDRAREVHELAVDSVRSVIGEPGALDSGVTGAGCQNLDGPTGEVMVEAKAVWNVDNVPADETSRLIDELQTLMRSLDDVNEVFALEDDLADIKVVNAVSEFYELQVVVPSDSRVSRVLEIWAHSPCGDPSAIR